MAKELRLVTLSPIPSNSLPDLGELFLFCSDDEEGYRLHMRVRGDKENTQLSEDSMLAVSFSGEIFGISASRFLDDGKRFAQQPLVVSHTVVEEIRAIAALACRQADALACGDSHPEVLREELNDIAARLARLVIAFEESS